MNNAYINSTLLPITTISFDHQTCTSIEEKEVYSTFGFNDSKSPENVLKDFYLKSISLIDKTMISAKKTYPNLF